jgi:hypothetical protein
MKLTSGILISILAAAPVWAQQGPILDNVRTTLNNSQQPKNAAMSAALAGPQAANASTSSNKAAQGKTTPVMTTPTIVAVPKSPMQAKPDDKTAVAVEDSKTAANMKSTKKELNFSGHRDPFVSPVVSRGTTGSGCSTGKRCLAIDQINVKGVIKSEAGMIAVVTNALDKAYFLRENDPVFNGYVVRITGDSVIFSESFEDKMGKPLTREVTKKITTPAV